MNEMANGNEMIGEIYLENINVAPGLIIATRNLLGLHCN